MFTHRNWLVVVLSFVVAVAAVLAHPGAVLAQRSAKIGAVFGVTGGIAAYGQSQRQGIELAAEHVNAAGGVLGAPVQLIFEDSGDGQVGAINAVRKLIDRDNVSAIVGPTLTAHMLAAGPVANDEGVPILGVSVTAVGITSIGEYVFRNSLPEEGVLPEVVARSIEVFNPTRVALIHDAADDFSVSGYHTFRREAADAGLEITADVAYQTKDTNFDAQITAVQATDPDLVIVSGLYQEAALLLQQMRQRGLNVPVVGGNGFNSPQLSAIAGSAAEGAIVGSPWYAGQETEAARRFVSAYEEAYGSTPDQFAAQAYDGFFLVVEAIKNAGTADSEAVRDALAAIKDFNGVLGNFSFDENRDPIQTPFVLQIKDGQYVELR